MHEARERTGIPVLYCTEYSTVQYGYGTPQIYGTRYSTEQYR
jgi:hypothetical protein